MQNPAMLGQVPLREVQTWIYPGTALGQGEEPAPPPAPPGNGGGGDRENRFFFPPFAPPTPYGPPHRCKGKLICRRDVDASEEEGEDVFVCERDEPEVVEPAPVPVGPRFPVFFLRPFGL